MRPVRVITRVGVFEGVSDGDVVHFDGPVLQSANEATLERNYLLVHEGLKLTRPAMWDDDWRSGAWYVDIVECFVDGDDVTVIDRYIDFIVPPSGASPYRVIDLEELGDALEAGDISVEAAARALRAAQAFVDTFLHRRGEVQGGSWKDFPPTSVRPYVVENRRLSADDVTPPPAPPDGWR